MKTLTPNYPLKDLCLVLGLSRSGYYKWRARQDSSRTQTNRQLIALIEQIHRQTHQSYGSPA